jgi:hypothetical protein
MMHLTAKDIQMAKDTHVTTPTRFVEAGGIRDAYRRFGAETGTPLVFNNAGVASSAGETPNTIDAMGDHVAAFVNALGVTAAKATRNDVTRSWIIKAVSRVQQR